MRVEVNGTSIAGVSSYKYLGIYLDQTLNFATHFDKIYKKATGRLNLLRRIRSSIDYASAEQIYRTMIMRILWIAVPWMVFNIQEKNRKP